jgi:hypothetical protein
VLANQTRTGEAVAPGHRWALTGEVPGGVAQAPLGSKAEAVPAKPACLEGVKKAPGADGAAEQLSC